MDEFEEVSTVDSASDEPLELMPETLGEAVVEIAPAVPVQPLYSKEGVLLNPGEVEVSREGVVTPRVV